MKPKAKKTLLFVLALLAAAILGGCLYLNSLMPIITGYAAKNLASDVFVSGREPSDVESLDLNFSFIKIYFRQSRNRCFQCLKICLTRPLKFFFILYVLIIMF